jgi:hypothetical protein
MTLSDYATVVAIATLAGMVGSLAFSVAEAMLVRRSVRRSLRGRS